MKVSLLPDNILRRMSPEDRKGLRLSTTSEIQQQIDSKSERELQRLILLDLNRRRSNRECMWFVHSRMDKRTTTAKGVPDFIILIDGRMVCLECKVGGNRLTTEQADAQADVVFAGGEFFVIRTFDDYKTHTQP